MALRRLLRLSTIARLACRCSPSQPISKPLSSPSLPPSLSDLRRSFATSSSPPPVPSSSSSSSSSSPSPSPSPSPSSLPSHYRGWHLTSYSSSPSSSLSLTSIPLSPLRPSHLLIHLHSLSFNPLDLWQLCGYGRTLLPLFRDASQPVVLGREGAGRVVAVGSGLWKERVGQEVWVSVNPVRGEGTMAEYVSVGADECGPKPSNLSMHEAASLPFALTTAWTALVTTARIAPRRTRAHAGKMAFIHGASGAVGLVAAQMLRAWGWHVHASVPTEAQAQRLAPIATVHVTQRKQEWHIAAAPLCPSASSSIPAPSSPVVSSSPPPHSSFSLFLDCVGSSSSSSAAALSLLSPGGHYLTLRGSFIRETDEKGGWKGGLEAGRELVEEKARWAARGLRFDWVVSQPSREALETGRRLVEAGWITPNVYSPSAVAAAVAAGENQQQQLAVPPKFVGIESVRDALEWVHQAKTQSSGKIVVDLVPSDV